MTYEELKIQLDINDPAGVLRSVGLSRGRNWLVVCDDGDCHLLDKHGKELDIKQLDAIEDYAFCGCVSLKRINIPSDVKSIGRRAFAHCTSLKSIKISSGVKSIGESAFAYCHNIKSIELPSSVKRINWYAFYNCNSLKSIKVPESVWYIGAGAFSYCDNLKSIVFRGRTLEQVRAMASYPWGIKDESTIICA